MYRLVAELLFLFLKMFLGFQAMKMIVMDTTANPAKDTGNRFEVHTLSASNIWTSETLSEYVKCSIVTATKASALSSARLQRV